MSLYNFYFDIVKQYKLKYNNCIVLMEVGTFYEVYSMEVGGGDVDIVSNVCEIEKTRCNKKIITHKDQDLNVKNPYMCGFQSKSLNEYIQLLINKNYNVVLVKQKLVDNKISRYVDSVITKSTFINDDIKSNNLLLCIYNNNEINYYCSIDLSTGINNIYTDDNNYIQILNPIEILYITNTPTNTNTNNDTNNTNNNTNNNILNTNIKITNKCINREFKKNSFQNAFLSNIFDFKNATRPCVDNTFKKSQSDNKLEIKNLLSPIENLNLEKYPNQIIAYIEMLNYIKNINNNLIYKIQLPIINYGKILQLSNNTITQLNLINVNDNYKYNSIYELLNNCKTNMGSRLLKYRLLNPIFNIKILNLRYKNINNLLKIFSIEKYQQNIQQQENLETYNNKYIYEIYNNYLINLIDTTKYVKKLILKTITPTQIYNLYNSYINIFNIIKLDDVLKLNICGNYLNKSLIINFEYLINLFTYHFNLPQTTENALQTNNQYTNIFNIQNHSDIHQLYLQYDIQINEINNLLKTLNNSFKTKEIENNVKLEFNEKEGYYFTTSNKKIKVLQQNFNDLNIKNLKSYTKFTNTQLNDINFNINVLKSTIDEAYKIKYISILNELNEFTDIMNYIDTYISNVDLYCGIAKSCVLYNLKCPTINKNIKGVVAKNVRHPLIEVLNNKLKYVGNDINLNNKNNGMLIYGINFSGKSSYLRSIGINVILAQCGFYVSADDFVFKPFTKIYTKIALQDNLFNEKSTFVNEMMEIKNIINNSDSRTLVLADELCSGTEPKSAIALVSSVINTLYNKNVKFIFTSHYHDLLKIKEITNFYIPYYFKVDVLPDGKMIFTRKLVAGITQSEYGVEVAKHIGINNDFINFALNIRNNLQSTTTLKPSKYNSNLIVDTCKVCGSNNTLHTHHIIYQKYFKSVGDKQSVVNNKNNLNNLIVLCEDCHIKLHKNLININEYIQTSEGITYN